MKKLISAALLAFATLTFHTAHAEEAYILASEYEHLIVNWSPSGKRLATVLGYECSTCAPKRMQINQDTELVNEYREQLPIEYLKSKVDWEGTVQTLNTSTTDIIKIMLH